jgi:hypothetical protein
MGAAGVLRYLAPVTPQTQGKILTAAERDLIFASDLDLALNFEWYEGRCLEGGAAGRQDAATALTQARALGYPPRRCIYFSHDTGQWTNAVLDYFDGVNAGLAGYYETGGYGGYGTVKALLDARKITRAWQTLAWSNGQREARAALYQNGRQWFGNAADENEVTGPVNGWRGITSGDSGLGGGVPIQGVEMLDPNDPIVIKLLAQTATANSGLTVADQQGDHNATLNALKILGSLVTQLSAVAASDATAAASIADVKTQLGHLAAGTATVDPVALAQAIAGHVKLVAS